jgi:protein involved in polysaccharide export with SLBB domain
MAFTVNRRLTLVILVSIGAALLAATFFIKQPLGKKTQTTAQIKISIKGQVKTPVQDFEVRNGCAILEAIEMAGGFTDRAKQDQILVTRQYPGRGESYLVVDCTPGTDPGNGVVKGNLILLDGDVISVH